MAIAALLGPTETLRHLADTVLWTYSVTTLKLAVIVALGTAAIGTGAGAYLKAAHDKA